MALLSVVVVAIPRVVIAAEIQAPSLGDPGALVRLVADNGRLVDAPRHQYEKPDKKANKTNQ